MMSVSISGLPAEWSLLKSWWPLFSALPTPDPRNHPNMRFLIPIFLREQHRRRDFQNVHITAGVHFSWKNSLHFIFCKSLHTAEGQGPISSTHQNITAMFIAATPVFCLTGFATIITLRSSLCRMGVAASNQEFRELPNKATDATLYYFAGRGLADQIR